MTYTEAMKIVKQFPEFVSILNNFNAHVLKCQASEQQYAGSWQFSVDGECFYYSGESYFDERDEKYHTLFEGGKHTPWRSRQLLAENRTWIVR